jgi:hypothetical protein
MGAQLPLREEFGQIRSLKDLRRAGACLARRLGLPRDPIVQAGYVPWKGHSTPEIEIVGTTDGYFTVATWAIRGQYKRPWDVLEYQLVCGVGFWLESYRRRTQPKGERPGLFDDGGTKEALRLWYGDEDAAVFIAGRAQGKRDAKWYFIVFGAVLFLIWLYVSVFK